jgi:sensor c-di-GMP phosphodiesterase-like protein
MRLTHQLHAQYLLLVVGAALGLLAADRIQQASAVRTGKADLEAYASRLEANAAEIDRQTEATLRTVLNDNLAFCSAEEILLMRGIVYNSSEIKDIGRLKERIFYCSSETGLIDQPFQLRPPDKTFGNVSIYASNPVMFGKDARGFIVQLRSANVVLNPHAFDQFRERPRLYSVYLYEPASGILVQGYGDQLPLSTADVVRAQPFERAGVFYAPLCSAQAHACVVSAESVAGMVRTHRPMRSVLLLVGATLGLSVTLSGLLLLRKRGSQEQQLRRAIRGKTLTVVYQPIVKVASRRVVAAEALLRWTNEDGEVVSPEVFIALAEEKDLIKAVTRLVIELVLKEMAATLRARDLRVTINVTAEDLVDPGFHSYLKECLEEHQLCPQAVSLELRESSTNTKPEFIDAIARLREAGHVIYIDDFGTGYSSLSYLRDLAADAIKIDRSFTASIGTSAVTACILPQILAIADQLGLGAVVEGVETPEQVAYFSGYRQDICLQGWHFGRPLPAQDFLATLD